jgi:hypothetical protein
VAVQEKKPARAKPSQAAMNAMAMDQSGAYQAAGQNYSVSDRHALH